MYLVEYRVKGSKGYAIAGPYKSKAMAESLIDTLKGRVLSPVEDTRIVTTNVKG